MNNKLYFILEVWLFVCCNKAEEDVRDDFGMLFCISCIIMKQGIMGKCVLDEDDDFVVGSTHEGISWTT